MVTCGADQKLKVWQKMNINTYEDESNSKLPISPTANPKFNNDFEFIASPIQNKYMATTGFERGM